jgi:hypothetical protein
MTRMILGSLVLLGALAVSAVAGGGRNCGLSKSAREVFHVSGDPGCRRGWQQLGSYETIGEAIIAAETFRTMDRCKNVEVSTGGTPTKPLRDHATHLKVYTRSCRKAGWQLALTTTEVKEANDLLDKCKKDKTETETVYHLPAKEVFYVSGGGCSRSWKQLGTYDTAAKACAAAEEFRTKEQYRRVVVSTGSASTLGSVQQASEFKVYARGCKIPWQLELTTKEEKKATELYEKYKKVGERTEIVYHLAAK